VRGLPGEPRCAQLCAPPPAAAAASGGSGRSQRAGKNQRATVCNCSQFLWCDLADSTGTRRLFATDPKSSLEPIVTEGQLERSLAHLVHSQPK
jgi:hypothetical protein